MNRCGLKPSPTGVRDYDFFACCGNSKQELPEKFMLPIDEWAEVLDQYDVLACVAYATATAAECHHYKDCGEKLSFSPGRTYGHDECRKGYNGTGMYLDTCLNGLTKIGFVPINEFDIIKEMPEMKQIVSQRADLDEIGKKRKLKGFVNLNYALESKKLESMKRAIYEYRIPLIVSSYNYFGDPHCFLLYGWGNSSVFALRNSWGKKYGYNGSSTIPFTYIDQAYLPIFEDMPMPFVDVNKNDWFYDDVRKAVFSGLVQGVTEKTFEPNGNMKRGDMALVISRMLDKLVDSLNSFIKTLNQKGIEAHEIALNGTEENTLHFADVDLNAYYHDAIQLVCANGIMNGTSTDAFEPEREITRAETATILTRTYDYAVKLLKDAIPSARITRPFKYTKGFSDVLDGEWYKKSVIYAAQLELMEGDGDGGFRPNDSITRAESTAVLNRLFKLVDRALTEIR